LALRGIKIFLQTGLDDSKITALEQPSDLPVGQLEMLPTLSRCGDDRACSRIVSGAKF
jgi:hypothetical protein